MGRINNKSKIKETTVRIAKDARINLLGSGSLIIRSWNENALIFTAAHVVDRLLKGDASLDLYLDIFEENHTCHNIKGSFTLASEQEEETVYKVYIPTDYNADTLTNDAAILVIPWQDWMKEILPIHILTQEAELDIEVQGWGYPLAMVEEAADIVKVDSEYEKECDEVKGTIKSISSFLYTFESEKYAPNRRKAMEGFSGGGIYEFSPDGPHYIGCISCPGGSKHAGNKAFLTPSRIFLKLMEAHKIPLHVTVSLHDYISFTVPPYDRVADKSIKKFERMVKDLVEKKQLQPCHFGMQDQEMSSSLPCNADRNHCPYYVKGELTKAACFLSLFEKDVAVLKDLKLKYGESAVRVILLCTEQKIYETFQTMLENKNFIDEGSDLNGTIFLWNDKDSDYYSRMLSREAIQNVIRDIIREKHYDIVDMEELVGNNRAFHIVDGDDVSCNLALIGMKYLYDEVVYNGNGVTKKMQTKLQNLLTESWEILSEDEDDGEATDTLSWEIIDEQVE